MRVLNLVTTPERSFYQQQLRALESQDIEWTTLSVPGRHDAGSDAVDGRGLSAYGRFYPAVLRRSFGAYDLIHANYGLTAPFALGQPRLPVVTTLWGGEFKGNRFERLVRASVRRSDEVVLASEAIPDVNAVSQTVIPFPVDTELFRPVSKDEARARVGWDPEATIVLFPYAPSRAEKNYPLAKRVVERAGVDATLKAVYGESHKAMADYMNASDTLLLTSRHESGPITVKEAVACNVPVVATDVGFVSSVLKRASQSYVCRSEDELVEGLTAVLHDNKRDDGRSVIKSYTVEDMGRALETVYRRCLKRTS